VHRHAHGDDARSNRTNRLQLENWLAGADCKPRLRLSARLSRRATAQLRRAAADKRSELAPLKRRIDALDQTIARLTRRIAEIDVLLADPKLYDRDPARLATLGKERAEAVSALAAAEDQWLALSSDYESAMAEG